MGLLVLLLIGAAAGSSCNSSSNCWTCHVREGCAWCGSKSSCVDAHVEDACLFTQVTDCCHTYITCRSCVSNAFCSWCDGYGCKSLDWEESIPLYNSSSGNLSQCATTLRYSRCDEVLVVSQQLDFVNLVFGLVVTVGCGLALAAIGALLFFVRKQVTRRKAREAYRTYLNETKLRSCTLCRDMLATSSCAVCASLMCGECASRNTCLNDQPHNASNIASGVRSSDGYESLAVLAARANE